MARRTQRAPKLTQFTWEGTDAKGRRIKGDNEAPNMATVKATLRRQGIRPIKVRRKPKPLFSFKRPIRSADVTFVSEKTWGWR